MYGQAVVLDSRGIRAWPGRQPTIVLVHGGFADGSTWHGVSQMLRGEGFPLRLVQPPATSLADDVAAVRRALDDEDNDVILVGHSYGGAVITEAGNDSRVKGLVYISAFVPDAGESVSWLINAPTPNAPLPLPLPSAALSGVVTRPSWRQKPTWYLVAADDRMLPPRAQWAMAKRARSRVTETGGDHSLHVMRPEVVAATIASAVRSVRVAKCA